MSVNVTAFWWRKVSNFGDLLTPLLLKHFCQVDVDWAPIEKADCVAVGSVLDSLPAGWSGIVAGAGKLHEGVPLADRLAHATVLGVRGPLTAMSLTTKQRQGAVIGDPGMLAAELVSEDKFYALGIVPHWSDHELEHRPEFTKYDPQIIRPGGDPMQVIRQIGRCRKIVSSSLHGIIVADSFGIPRRTEMAASMDSPWEGKSYKFRDYAGSVGLPFEVGLLQEPVSHLVDDRQQEVYDMLDELGLRLRALRA